MKKKLLVIMLAIAMVMTFIPVLVMTASAAEVASGTSGDVNWTLTDDGTLTFSGEGAMADYSNGSQPWYAYKDSIKTVIVTKGVTSISTNAFREFSALATVKIAGSVTAIGNHAFYSCTNLSTVEYYGSSNPTAGSTAFFGTYGVVKVPSSYSGTVFCEKMVQATLDATNEPLPPCDHAGHTQTGCTACGATDESIHSFVNGFCTVCDSYEQPTLNADGYYEIDNAGKLYWFAKYVNSGEQIAGADTSTNIDDVYSNSANAVLTANIVVNQNVLKADGSLNGDGSNFRVWTPIGYYNSATDEARYAGTFDGNGYTVSGLYVNSEDQNYVGMFGDVGTGRAMGSKQYGTVKNVGVIGSYFKGYEYVGGIAGSYAGTDLTNCFNASTIVAVDYYAGGIVGQYSATGKYLKNCYNLGSVSGNSRVGGIVGNVGNLGSYVADCYNLGTVKATSSAGGGVIGNPNPTENTLNCYYLIGCAEAGGVTQNGMGYRYSGNQTTADTEGSTMGMPMEAFVSGEVAYKLGEAWGQTIGSDNYPVFAAADDSNKVYYGYLTCATDAVKVYTNDNKASENKIAHTLTYTANGSTVNATCSANDCGYSGSVTVKAEGKLYDGTPVIATLDGSIERVATPEITYTGNTNAGTHTASITFGDATASVNFTIEKTTPLKMHFNYTYPADLTYNGEEKAITVTVKDGIVGMGDFNVWYKDSSNNRVQGAPINAGNYDLYIEVAEGDNYEAETVEAGYYTIEKATPVLTEPTAIEDLIYNGDALALMNAGSTTGGTLKYGVIAGEYNSSNIYGPVFEEALPTATNAGPYIVFYMVEGDDNYERVEIQHISVTVGKAKPTLDVTSPVTSVLPGNTILLSYTLTGVKGEALTNAVSIDSAKIGTLTCNIDGLKITVPSTAVIGGEDKLVVTLKSAAGGNYDDSDVFTLTLGVGMADFSGAITELEADIEELRELIDQKASTADVTSKLNEITSKISALEQNGATDAELEAAIDAAKSEVTQAYEQMIGGAVADLETKIAAQIDPNELAEAVADLEGLIDAAKAYADAQDAVLKQQLDDKISDANALIASLDKRVSDAEKAIDEIETAIENLKAADAADAQALEDAIAELEQAIDNAEQAATSADTALKTELNGKIERADAALEAKIAEVQANLNKAIDDLEKADSSNSDALRDAINILNNAIDAAEAAAITGDSTLEGKITDAQNALEAKIAELQSNLEQAKKDLEAEIENGNKELSDKITALNTAINAAEAAAIAGDNALKAELERQIAEAKTALNDKIDDVKAELEQAIADLETAT